MKKIFFKLGLWATSFLFNRKSKKEAQLESVLDENKIQEDFENEVNDSAFKNENENTEKEVLKNEMIFYTKKSKSLFISTGEEFQLTEKQLIFYNIIKGLQGVYGFASSHDILRSFLNEKYGVLSNDEFKDIIAKTNQKLSSHGKTMKGMFKSGLLERISKNKYRVKI